MIRTHRAKTLAAPNILALAAALVLASPEASAAETNVFLGRARNFAVLAGSSINNTGQTIVVGSIGVAPGTRVVGFPPERVGRNTTAARNAQTDLTSAYNDAAGRSNAVPFSGSGILGPGLYRASALNISPGGLVLDAGGNPAAVFIFQADTTLTVPANTQVSLAGAARAANVFWQVGDSAIIGANSMMKGSILANQSITMESRATLEGRALGRNGDVVLDRNVITTPSGGTTNDPPLDVFVLGPISLNPQTGLFEQVVRIVNVGVSTNAFRGVAALIRGLPTDVQVRNGSSGGSSGPFVSHDFPLASGQSVTLVIEYYRANRQPFTQPTYFPTVIIPPVSRPQGGLLSVDRALLLQNGRVLIEFSAKAGKRYVVQYNTNGTDTTTWLTADPAITAGANRVQWLDDGPPKTVSPPGGVGNRLYRVVELP